jgi:dipeptidyl aminopeptidase/acylaminoacyl peptidase
MKILRNALRFSRCIPALALLLSGISVSPAPAVGQSPGQLTFQDLMQVRQIRQPSISADGRWVALAAVPDRGDGELLVYEVDGNTLHAVPRGSGPIISANSQWVALRIDPTFEARETARGDDRPRSGLALLALGSGDMEEWEDVRNFAFSGDGRWLARLHFGPREEDGEEGDPDEDQDSLARVREDPGTELVLRNLGDGSEETVSHVSRFSFHSDGSWLAYVVAAPDGEGDGLYVQELGADQGPEILSAGPFAHVESMAWWDEGLQLAWVMSQENHAGDPGQGTLHVWDGTEVEVVVEPGALDDGWVVPASNDLSWTRDGDRLFFGARPPNQAENDWTLESEVEDEDQPFDAFDLDGILEDRGVDVWHTMDPFINSNQKRMWNRMQSRTFATVYHRADGRVVRLGDPVVQLQGTPENPTRALGTSDVPYQRESTWTGGAEDLFVIDLETGTRHPFFEGFEGGGSAANSWIGVSGPSMSLSPGGRFVVWFADDHWHLFDAETGSTSNLTAGLDAAFFDQDHDLPNARGGHGIGGWMEDDEGVLIHDKFDVWLFPTNGDRPRNLTDGEGKRRGLILRAMRLDPEQRSFSSDRPIVLASFNVQDKGFGFHQTHPSRGGLEVLLDEDRRFRILAKAEDADRILYSREDYDEFPDLWVADLDLGNGRRVTDVNPGLLDRFAWGTSELVEWTSDDGIPLQGVLIKPSDFREGQRYPVLTYFYRFFSQRLHEFNQPVVNHRPSFPIYASDGYLVFLPDVRFEVGRPGISSLKSVVPGLKKLVEMGVADPDALGLHGHSWSGYTTSYIVTQTNIFAAAVAGAPVSNMTSAYGGIRWGSGLARQFQYEKGQSRLSGSLFDKRYEYVENSPLFYADRVETPLVIMHGDEDEAVPWYQSIEFYLALRRAGKHSVFLQYRGEPHHPQEYSNKLDYSIKMKEFFDHYLKGAPAPEWWSKGVLYSGR